MSSETSSAIEKPDALWNDEKAYEHIDNLFKNKNFLSVAQKRIENHGTPISMEKWSENFNKIMARWEKKTSLLED
jgi:hypothetical protein